jgi:hypothetical protein
MLKTKMRAITRYLSAAAILASLAFLVNFIPVSIASGTSGASSGLLVGKIIEHRDFFTRFDGYDENFLCDVNNDLGENRIGLLLLEPSGFLKSLVFDRETLKKVHEEASVPPKKARVDLAHSAVLVSDARLIARNIFGLRTESTKHAVKRPRRKTVHRETQRREAMPQSLPAGFDPSSPRKTIDTKKALERMRRDVQNNPALAIETSEEILERLRSEVVNTRKKEIKTLP